MHRRVQIDPELQRRAPEPRRREWRALAADLEGGVFGPADSRMFLRLEGRAVYLSVVDVDDRPCADGRLHRDELADVLDEYLHIIRQMAIVEEEGDVFRRLEVLDMAKKVVHDRGGHALRERLAGLALDHRTARRLFTLVVALFEDTTQL